MRFNGVGLEAFAGDTLASALLANGIHLVGRSFKYHRPRGIFSHGSRGAERAAVGRSRRRPRRAEQPRDRIEAVHGLTLRSQNHWPSLRFDVGAVNDALSPLFVAGFYYKTFMWPRSFWDRVYEPAIRAAAGLGRAPDRAGSRPLPARPRALRRAGGRRRPGGPRGRAGGVRERRARHPRRRAGRDGRLAAARAHLHHRRQVGVGLARGCAGAIEACAGNVTLLPRTTAFGYYNHNHLGLVERVTDHLADPPPDCRASGCGRCARARWCWPPARTSARWCSPATTGRASCWPRAARVRQSLRRGAGTRAVIVTSGASAYTAAVDLEAAGVEVTVVDVRPHNECAVEAAACAPPAARCWPGTPCSASRGRRRVSGLIVAPVDAAGHPGARRTLPCDCVGLSGGWTPAVHLFSQSRGKLAFDAELDAFVPAVPRPGRALGGGGARNLSACRPASPKAGAPVPTPQGSHASAGSRRARPGPDSGQRACCRRLPPRGSGAPSSISRTTSRPRTSGSPCAKASTRSSTSSATPPPAWRPTRARRRT